MSPSTPLRRTAVAAAACLSVTLSVSACRDSGSDPAAVLVTEQTHSALALDAVLPSLPDLAARTQSEDRLADAVGSWMRSWQSDSAQGTALRTRAYADASGPLAGALGHDGVARTLEQVGAALDASGQVEPGQLPPSVMEQIAGARRLARDGRAALEAGRDASALEDALRASDEVREVGPQAVAMVLLSRAEAALADQADAPTLDEKSEARSQRLVEGARSALREQDWSRAIQRAFYACQLLGVPTS